MQRKRGRLGKKLLQKESGGQQEVHKLPAWTVLGWKSPCFFSHVIILYTKWQAVRAYELTMLAGRLKIIRKYVTKYTGSLLKW